MIKHTSKNGQTSSPRFPVTTHDTLNGLLSYRDLSNDCPADGVLRTALAHGNEITKSGACLILTFLIALVQPDLLQVVPPNPLNSSPMSASRSESKSENESESKSGG
jgi:hypothetical protein